ncbi:hypothetical protein BDY24DRAFT_167343 [Mrakia frigida]|uniref:uncharacterized protein n=1 Tax=Mrakia frigida TaxID=29902 RepID=UPI003FCC21CE
MNASTPTPSTNPPVIPPSTASHALHSLVASVLLEAGFDGADPQVVLELERMTFELITTVHTLSTSYANHSNRLHPSAYDLLEACLDQGFEVEDLYKSATTKLQKSSDTLPILPPPSPPPAFLPSDDEAEPSTSNPTTSTKRKKLLHQNSNSLPLPEYAHPHAPPLPPGHSWKNTTKVLLHHLFLPLPPSPKWTPNSFKPVWLRTSSEG